MILIEPNPEDEKRLEDNIDNLSMVHVKLVRFCKNRISTFPMLRSLKLSICTITWMRALKTIFVRFAWEVERLCSARNVPEVFIRVASGYRM